MMPSSSVVMFGSGLLLCIYVAAVSLDLLVRWLPSRLPAWDAVTLLATWWLFVIPMGLASGISFLLMPLYDQFSCSLYTLTGGWAVLYLAGMMIAPLWLMRRARMRLLAGRGA